MSPKSQETFSNESISLQGNNSYMETDINWMGFLCPKKVPKECLPCFLEELRDQRRTVPSSPPLANTFPAPLPNNLSERVVTWLLCPLNCRQQEPCDNIGLGNHIYNIGKLKKTDI